MQLMESTLMPRKLLKLNKPVSAIALLLIIFLTPCFTRLASAHILQTDGAISVLLHTNPDDDPIIGKPADLLFLVSDRTSGFTTANCNCAITISKDNKQLLGGPLTKVDSLNTIFGFSQPFTFPQKGIYTVVVTGSPKTPKSFQNFQVKYDLRVARENSLPSYSSLAHLSHSAHFWHYLLFGMAFLVAGILSIKEKRKLKKLRNNH
jgi:hypothetical protein